MFRTKLLPLAIQEPPVRKAFLCLALVSVFALLTGLASSQEKDPLESNNLQAAALAAFNCIEQPGNIVLNCQFQSGRFAPWTNTGDTSFSSVAACGHIAGTNCAFMGPLFYLGELTQVLPTTPGQNYTLSFWVANRGRPSDFEVWWGDPVRPFHSKVEGFPDMAYTPFTYNVTASSFSTPLTFDFYNVPSFTALTDVAVFPQ